MVDNSVVPIVLDKGLDTITHPTLAEAGTLLDCLNYEMAGGSGYRRIEGFERYDGWFSGDIADYYIVPVSITDVAIESTLVPGATLWSNNLVLGIVANYYNDPAGQIGTLYYVPANNEAPLIKNGTLFDTDRTLARASTTAVAVKGSATVSSPFYLDNIRSYSSTLRNLVQAQTTPVAGLHWFRNNLIMALDCPVFNYTDADSVSRDKIKVGSIVQYQTTAYRVVARVVTGNSVKIHVEPVLTGLASSAFRSLSESLNVVLHTPTITGLTLTYNNSDYAYLVAANTPLTSKAGRGNTYMIRSVTLQFTGGVAAAASDMVVGGFIGVGDTVTSKKAQGMVRHIEITSGSFAANNAAGYVEVIFLDPATGTHTDNRDYITTTDDIINTSMTTKYADISNVTWSVIPGTNTLRTAGTRYQWITANFFGQEDTTEAFGATGAGRAFWAQAYSPPVITTPPAGAIALNDSYYYSWGNIYTDRLSSVADKPKYVAFHGFSLAFAVFGSVIRSVAGQPKLFDGALGATETATGDDITGLLEAQDDTLIVLGRRAIRRITGTTSNTISLKNIAPGAGAFDYSGVIVGSMPVFTGPAGITSLVQAMTYGDFAGERITDSVSNTLVPKLITDWADTEPGGVIMALPVRRKDQYRLWLSSGEVYTVSFTKKGNKVMKSNYGFTGDARVPFAWTSAQADSGKEHIMIVWDDVLASTNVSVTGQAGTLPNPKQVYELERGWGFDGKTFSHFFDLAHTFGTSQSIQISQIRLHGWSYGLATLDIKSAGVEDDYDQPWHNAVQDISLPKSIEVFTPTLRPATSIVDQANWGLGIKLRINGTKQENLTTTEPIHICQVLVMQANPEGANDN